MPAGRACIEEGACQAWNVGGLQTVTAATGALGMTWANATAPTLGDALVPHISRLAAAVSLADSRLPSRGHDLPA